jgi:hypothetical protein
MDIVSVKPTRFDLTCMHNVTGKVNVVENMHVYNTIQSVAVTNTLLYIGVSV